ncbi:nuclear transport factor 2 family protein [Streptomyces sp. NPDC047315]|uniref:nuclear transport factor 2 family protein n=1 Tax=Streptomyces sp. NPDC047315 TaxID=3155142 RepID=UPI0033CAA328
MSRSRYDGDDDQPGDEELDPVEAAARAEVEAANTAYYEAMERGDTVAMAELWLPADDVSCVHPGWPVLQSRGEVLRSYAVIMEHTEYIQFFLTDVRASVAADTAVVTCTENILSGGPAEEAGELGPLVGQHVVATNVFRRTAAGWQLWSHHGSPVLAEGYAEEDGLGGADGADGERGGGPGAAGGPADGRGPGGGPGRGPGGFTP